MKMVMPDLIEAEATLKRAEAETAFWAEHYHTIRSTFGSIPINSLLCMMTRSWPPRPIWRVCLNNLLLAA